MKRFWTFIFIFFSGLSLNAQDWLKNSVPKDLNSTCLIIEKIDSIGSKCRNGKKMVYCSDFEKNIDKQLSTLQKLQEAAFQKYNFPYIMVLPEAFPYQEYADLKDVNQYRYILKMHFFQGDGKTSIPTWLYYFYDRKTQKALPRIHQIPDVRFKHLKELINALNKKFETVEK